MGVVVQKVFQGGAGFADLGNEPIHADLSGKRLFDIVASLALIFLFSPFFLVLAVAIKLDSSGPVFFRQQRTGKNKRPFRIWKFRTMTVMEDGAGVVQATRNDKRVTRIGKLLRCSSVDELPQLFNVLAGDMSLVGPRPHACEHDRQFAKDIKGYDRRFAVRPGITGLAQVSGFRGETKTTSRIRARVRADRIYIERRSFALDMLILVRTAIVVIWGRNAY